MGLFRRIFLLMILTGFTAPVMAQDMPVDPSTDTRTSLAADETHPVYSSDSRWVASLLIGIVGLFVAAMLIGPIVKSEAPEAVPVAISHEEDPAADRH